MTTNKPEVKRFNILTYQGAIQSKGAMCVLASDYDALQAECEKLRKDAETERAIQRAAEVLPPGLSIEIEIEKNALVSLFGPGSRVSCDFQGSLAEQINDAIDAATQGDHP